MSIVLMRVLPWLLLLMLLATWVPWRNIFEKIYGNNPYKAKVYVEAGEQITICKGKYYGDYSKGILYRFKYMGAWNTVIVPAKYPYRYLLGCRQIRVLIGQPVAAPLGGMIASDIKVSSSTLDDIFNAQIGKELAKSIFGKAMNIMTILIIVAVAIFACYFLYKQTQPGGMFNNQPISEQTAPIENNKPGPYEQDNGPLR